jgi:hypothetical protein
LRRYWCELRVFSVRNLKSFFGAISVGADADAATRKDQLPIALGAAPVKFLDDVLRRLQNVSLVEKMIALGARHFLWHLHVPDIKRGTYIKGFLTEGPEQGYLKNPYILEATC